MDGCEDGGTSAAWLYNMIALVLTQQLRGTIEDRINNLTVRQLGRLSGTVEAYSAGLIKVSVVKDDEEDWMFKTFDKQKQKKPKPKDQNFVDDTGVGEFN